MERNEHDAGEENDDAVSANREMQKKCAREGIELEWREDMHGKTTKVLGQARHAHTHTHTCSRDERLRHTTGEEDRASEPKKLNYNDQRRSQPRPREYEDGE